MTRTNPAAVDRVVRGAHAVVVGAGGLGCPAAWALAEAGVGRLTVIDPDVVEPSNLPRQVLFRSRDLGRPKAQVAAERLVPFGGRVEGRHARLDDTNVDEVLADADVVLDATDGALAKDWLNAVAVRRDVPLVHAAAVRSEGRLLEVPAGGRPCLACLFGRLSEEPGGTCADLGVWGGVVGSVGFLAADAALRRLASPRAASRGYLVLDVEGGRALTLAAERASDCPVCGEGASRAPEPYPPAPAACRTDDPGTREHPEPTAVLDLVEESCPMNLLRARREVEALERGATLEILLGAEGAASVPDGLRALGHVVLAETPRAEGPGLVLRVRRGDAACHGTPLTRDQLVRYARQVVLPEVGEAGQRRLLGAEASVAGRGAAAETATVYLRAAGVGRVVRERRGGAPIVRLAGGTVLSIAADASGQRGVVRRAPAADDAAPGDVDASAAGPVARALGALLADAACRQLVAGAALREPPGIVLGADGTVASRVSPLAPS